MADALIHLRVPAATKGRWVRESRAAGMRLTDWVVQIIEERNMNKTYDARMRSAIDWLHRHWTSESSFYHLTEEAALDHDVSLPELQRAWDQVLNKK